MAYSVNEGNLMAKRFRLRFTFWLDMQKPDETELAETIEILKQNRSFVATIRDGIRLICDLKAGQTEVLFELFPWVSEALRPVPAPTEQRLQEQINRLEALLLAQGNIPIQSPSSFVSTPRAHSAPSSEPNIVITGSSKATAREVADNFLKSFASSFFD
jgi:hypothetical protein